MDAQVKYFQNIPDQLKYLFPTYIAASEDPTGLITLHMARVQVSVRLFD